MHKSQLAGFILDCNSDDLQTAADFWGAALGVPAEQSASPDEENYRMLKTAPGDLHIEVQKVAVFEPWQVSVSAPLGAILYLWWSGQRSTGRIESEPRSNQAPGSLSA